MAEQGTTESVPYLELLTDPRFKIVLLVSAAGMIGSLLPPALPALGTGLNVGDETIGYVITAYKLPSILIIPIAAAVADIYGRRTVLLPSLVLFAVAGSLMVFIRSFSTMLLFALLLGIGAAAIFPLTVTLLGDFFQDELNSAGQGIRVGVIGLGAVLVPIATGYLADINWNYPFLLFFLVFPVAGIVYLFLKEPVKQDTSKRPLQTTATEYLETIRIDLSDPALAVLLGGGFVRGFSRYALVTFVPLFAVRTLGASLIVAGILLSIRGVVYTLVAPFAGELVKRFTRKWLLGGSLFASGVALFALPFVPDVAWLGVLVGCHAFGDAMFDPVNKSTVTAMARKEYRAGIVNTLYVLKRIGQTTSPVIFGLLLAASNYQTLFVSAALVIGGYVLLFSWLFVYKPTSGR